MCGITGVVRLSGGTEMLSATVSIMTNQLAHRGPDAGAVWVDAEEGIGLGHRRLSILDLSEAGAQPMHSADQRYVISFNGEIYNHLELRRELNHQNWRGGSDTETLLAAIEQWGFGPALERMVGMFAIALWDRQRRELILARDRMGEKPIYYGWFGGVFLFGSELKALTSFPGWQGEVDRESLTLYLRYSSVPVPRTIWKGVHKLSPGSYLTISQQTHRSSMPRPVYYWQAAKIASLQVIDWLDDAIAAQELDAQLRHVIAGQMIADVPLGAFLSGGVDSSVIAAIMQVQSNRPVNTFTIGFGEADYDEAKHARAVAEHLGTNHTEFHFGPSDALALIPRLADIYDEPFGDSSQLPTCLLANMARQHVSVCLSGDAGDELFGGYNRYIWGPKIWSQIGSMPLELRRFLSKAIKILPSHFYNWITSQLPHYSQQRTFRDQLHKLASILDAAYSDEIYLRLVSQIQNPGALVIGGGEPQVWADIEAASFVTSSRKSELSERMMFRDLVGYLPDDILTKVDRAAMASGLETRIPFLDHRLFQFASSLPLNMKIRNGKGKWLLREVLYRYVPKELIERPKQGFGVPIDSWLRGPLYEWAESLLDENKLRREGFFKPEPIRRKWQEHLSGHRNSQHWLWNILMFQAWHERWL